MSDLFMVIPTPTEKPEPELLDLPDAEMHALCLALSPDRVGYQSYSSAKRIAAIVSGADVGALSPKLRDAAIRIAYTYRRQMPTGVIALLSRWPAATFKRRP